MPNPMSARMAGLYPGTPAEHAIEPAIASMGVKYRWQYPTYLVEPPLRSFLDFAIWIPGHMTPDGQEWKIDFEVDDPSHDSPKKRAADKERSAALRAKGWRVVRCTNEDALRRPVATVNLLMRRLGVTAVATLPPRSSSAAPQAARQEEPTDPTDDSQPTATPQRSSRR